MKRLKHNKDSKPLIYKGVDIDWIFGSVEMKPNEQGGFIFTEKDMDGNVIKVTDTGGPEVKIVFDKPLLNIETVLLGLKALIILACLVLMIYKVIELS